MKNNMKKCVYYVGLIGGPYDSDQAGLNRGPAPYPKYFQCYFV